MKDFLAKKRNKIRGHLRNYGILPEYNEPLTNEQEIIWNQISNNDFSYWEQFKKDKKNDNYSFNTRYGNTTHGKTKSRIHPPEKTKDLKISRRLYEFRQVGLLPPINHPLTDKQNEIIDLINTNYNISIDSFISANKHLTTPEQYLWYKTKHHAYKQKKHRDKDIIFNLLPEDIFIPKYCPYLNLELKFEGCTYDNSYYNIDRIDSSLGYIKGNVQIISRLANLMKTNATINQLITFSENVLKLHKP
jgi:hypothetical protein